MAKKPARNSRPTRAAPAVRKAPSEERCRLVVDAIPMALVTVNRTLRELRRTGSVDFKGGRIFVLDWKALTVLGEFDPEYLNA